MGSSQRLLFVKERKMDKVVCTFSYGLCVISVEKIKVFLSKGLNQSKIAQELGISRQAVSKLCKEI